MGILRLLLGAVLDDERERSSAAARQSGPSQYRHPLEDTKKPPLDPQFQQIAGEKCRSCKDTIVAHKDGTRCEACGKALHHDCVARHAAKCAQAKAPYR
jgi:hypothetical protein